MGYTKYNADVLLANGVDIIGLKPQGETPLHKAAFRMDYRLVFYFLGKGAAPLGHDRLARLALQVTETDFTVFESDARLEVDGMIDLLRVYFRDLVS